MARLSDLKRAAETFQITLTTPSGSSHFKFYNSAGKMYPVPAPNGLKSELDKKYLKGFCRAFVLDYETQLKPLL